MSQTQAKLWYLKQVELFSDLKEDDLAYVSSCFSNKNYSKEFLISQDTTEKRIYLVKTGLVEISAITEDGKKIIIDLLGAGSIFGNLYAQDDLDFIATTKKPSLICTMSTDDFFELVSKYPGVSEKLMRSLYSQLLRQKERISSLASETVTQRLLRLLKDFPNVNSHSDPPAFTHEELAQMIGTSRQTVTTILNQLQKDGVVTKVEGKYMINVT